MNTHCRYYHSPRLQNAKAPNVNHEQHHIHSFIQYEEHRQKHNPVRHAANSHSESTTNKHVPHVKPVRACKSSLKEKPSIWGMGGKRVFCISLYLEIKASRPRAHACMPIAKFTASETPPFKLTSSHEHRHTPPPFTHSQHPLYARAICTCFLPPTSSTPPAPHAQINSVNNTPQHACAAFAKTASITSLVSSTSHAQLNCACLRRNIFARCAEETVKHVTTLCHATRSSTATSDRTRARKPSHKPCFSPPPFHMQRNLRSRRPSSTCYKRKPSFRIRVFAL